MTRSEPRSAPGDAPIVTGSGDDGRRRLLQLVIGFLGWALLIALVWYLASHASVAAVDLAIVFVTAITIVAIFSTVTAVQLRARLIDQRAMEPEFRIIDHGVDTLGRRIEVPVGDLSGEIVLSEQDGVRRYSSRPVQ
jgi:hypothetical protein